MDRSLGRGFLKKIPPVYPSKAKLQGIEGRVVLNGVVDTNGHFRELNVLAGPPMLQQPALDAVKQWVYSPFLLDGNPAEMETDLNVIFNLGP